jgi:hypothetical protein
MYLGILVPFSLGAFHDIDEDRQTRSTGFAKKSGELAGRRLEPHDYVFLPGRRAIPDGEPGFPGVVDD